MESTACVVQDAVRLTEHLDGMDGLLPAPSQIKGAMPELARMLQQLADQVGADAVQAMVRASMALRRAYDADDYHAVAAVYARRVGWITWAEGGHQLGVPEAHMAAFARRHREGPRR